MVSTASTKSRDRKLDNRQAIEQAEAETPAPDASEISPLVWRAASLIILAGAAFIRLYELGLKPMHHDEGVNGFFLTSLFRQGVYHYDPNNYHGPTLYYFALVVTKINGLIFGSQAGLSTNAVRLVPVIFGVGTVWLVLCLRRNIGAIGALAAAAMVAFSPGLVFISRYFIHESHFVFFTLGIVVAAIRYYESADPLYLLLAAFSAAFLFATKETAIISAGVLLLSFAVAEIYKRLMYEEPVVRPEKKSAQRKAKRAPVIKEDPLERFGGIENIALWSGVCLLLFIFINILFYSSFFTYWQGVSGAIKSLQVWTQTGTKEHGHPFWTYLDWLWQEESSLLILGAIGAGVALIRRGNRFAIFAGAWAFGLLLAYSLIPYKTPWLMINFTVPLAIAGGYAINEIYHYGQRLEFRIVSILVAAVALVILGVQTVSLNFYHYDDEAYPYVYAHTRREFLAMVNDIEDLSKKAGTGTETKIAIVSRDYWPLPWYLRNYEHAGFYGQMAVTDDPLILGSTEEEAELDSRLGDRYQKINTYPMRPGVTLVLYARKELTK